MPSTPLEGKTLNWFWKGKWSMGVEILTLGEASWRQVGKIFSSGVRKEQVIVHCAIHWLTSGNRILRFKIADESFHLIECPAKDTSGDDQEKSRFLSTCDNLTEYEGRLCVVRRHWHPWKLKFFVMEDYVNRVWIEHAINLMRMDETPFSHSDGFKRRPTYEPIEGHDGKLVLMDDGGMVFYQSKKCYYYFNPTTNKFENCDGKPQTRLQYKESLISARKICFGENI